MSLLQCACWTKTLMMRQTWIGQQNAGIIIVIITCKSSCVEWLALSISTFWSQAVSAIFLSKQNNLWDNKVCCLDASLLCNTWSWLLWMGDYWAWCQTLNGPKSQCVWCGCKCLPWLCPDGWVNCAQMLQVLQWSGHIIYKRGEEDLWEISTMWVQNIFAILMQVSLLEMKTYCYSEFLFVLN